MNTQMIYLRQIFPFTQRSLIKTFFLIKQTNVEIKEFRIFMYKTIFEENLEEINFQDKNLASIFYWFILSQISKKFPLISNFLIQNISVEDNFDTPMYRLISNEIYSSDQDYIKAFFDKLVKIIKNLEILENIEAFDWFIKQLFSDILCREYMYTKVEIIPDTILKLKTSNLELFRLNEETISKMINRKFTQFEEIEMILDI